MESTLNYSISPLESGRAYIGRWEKILYPTATITLLSDTVCEIVAYQSLNKTQEQTTTFETIANQYNTFNLDVNLPYIYFSVRNSTANNQTLLNFSVMYKDAYIPSNDVNNNVNITNTQIPVSQNGNWNIAVNNFPTTQPISGSVSITAIAKGNSTLWDLVSTGINGTSSSLNLSNATQTNITFFGMVSGATNLIVQFSLDGTSFYSSQYSYNVSTAGEIGFNIQASPYYCRLLSTNDITAKIIATYN